MCVRFRLCGCNIQFRCRETNDLIARRRSERKLPHLGRHTESVVWQTYFETTACKIQTARLVVCASFKPFTYSRFISLSPLLVHLPHDICICKQTLELYAMSGRAHCMCNNCDTPPRHVSVCVCVWESLYVPNTHRRIVYHHHPHDMTAKVLYNYSACWPISKPTNNSVCM